MADLIQMYSDSIATLVHLGHFNTTFELNRRHHIVGCLDF